MAWIKVKTRLPKTDKHNECSEWCVVQYGINAKPEYKAVYYDSDLKQWLTYWQENIRHVTHWQYLEPPKDK